MGSLAGQHRLNWIHELVIIHCLGTLFCHTCGPLVCPVRAGVNKYMICTVAKKIWWMSLDTWESEGKNGSRSSMSHYHRWSKDKSLLSLIKWQKLLTYCSLTHWGRATHICVGKLTNIGSDNGLSPGRRQAIIRTIAGILSIGPLGTNFSEILIGIQTFSFKKMHLKMSSAKWHLVSASKC